MSNEMAAIIEVRRATVTDADAIADVHARSWPSRYQGLVPDRLIADVVAGRDRRAAAFRELLTDESSPQRIWVAIDGDAVVGMAIWSPSRDEDATESTADLEAIYLDPDFIGQGLGRTLMQRVVDDIAQAGFTEATLWVLGTNERARRFYEAAGWRVDGATKVEERPAGTLSEVRYRKALESDGWNRP